MYVDDAESKLGDGLGLWLLRLMGAEKTGFGMLMGRVSMGLTASILLVLATLHCGGAYGGG